MRETLEIPAGSIVVAVDGSEHAGRAVAWAAEQARLEGRHLAVFHAAGHATASTDGSRPPSIHDLKLSAEPLVEDAVSLVTSTQPEIEVSGHTEVGDPRQLLVDMSVRVHLIVMGSRGRGTIRSLLLGSVSADVSRRADCPVVICRPAPPVFTKTGVVVGADGTPESRPVIEFAFQQAALRGLPLDLRHYYRDVAALGGGHPTPLAPVDTERLRAQLSDSVAELVEKYPDVNVAIQVSHGLAEERLDRGARPWELVVVGRHPTESGSRSLHDSVATAVLEHSHSTVAVVPEATPAPL